MPIKIKQKQNDNVYFQEPSSICESESIAYLLLYTSCSQRLLTARFLKSALDAS